MPGVELSIPATDDLAQTLAVSSNLESNGRMYYSFDIGVHPGVVHTHGLGPYLALQ